MQKIVIAGAGGFGREVQWLIDRINHGEKKWELIGFIDDAIPSGTMINNLPVLGNLDYLVTYPDRLAVACAIGASEVRRSVIKRLLNNHNLEYPNLIDPSVLMSESVRLGIGAVICAGSIITVNIEVYDFVTINLDCTIGHDVRLNKYVTLYPGVHVSGSVEIGEASEIGTGAQIIQGVKILNDSVIGAGAVVVNDIPAKCTAVGCPAKPIKFST